MRRGLGGEAVFYTVVAPPRSAGYVRRVIRGYYGEWMSVSATPAPGAYNIELRPGHGSPGLKGPLHVVEYTGSRSIESLPPHEIVRAIERARARLRLTATFRGCHVLDSTGAPLRGWSVHPGYDMFFLIGEASKTILGGLGANSPPENPLVLKRFRGVHEVYCGDTIAYRIEAPDEGASPRLIVAGECTRGNRLRDLIEYNMGVLEAHISVSRRIITASGDYDVAVVSFSGGKDSLVVLDLAIRLLGRKRVRPVFVDTGLEFPETIEYLGEVERYYGVSIERVYAGVDRAVKSMGLPRASQRWCTELKTRAFEKKLAEYTKEYDRVLVLVGDRDAESAARSHRPPVRRIRRGVTEATPIKQWSTALIQLYIHANRLPVNPLYSIGFYRVGCYVCPALRSLELFIIRRMLWSRLKDKPYLREFLEAKGAWEG